MNEAPRIVVGVDGSEASAQALRWALRQAVLVGAVVEAVACWQWPAAAGGFAPYADFDLSAPTRTVAQDEVDKALADTTAAELVVVTTTVVEGYPAGTLVARSHGALLLVVGSRGHGTLRGMLLGSVGLHCVTHATCPVVVVHPQPVEHDHSVEGRNMLPDFVQAGVPVVSA